MKRTLKIAGAVIAGLILLGLLLPDSGERPDQSLSAGESVVEGEALPEIRAADLYAAYEANPIAADRDWKDKRVAVTGTVGSIGRELTGKAYVVLDSEGLIGVQCVFARGDDSAARLAKGQEVTLVGRVSGKLMNVLVNDCELR